MVTVSVPENDASFAYGEPPAEFLCLDRSVLPVPTRAGHPPTVAKPKMTAAGIADRCYLIDAFDCLIGGKKMLRSLTSTVALVLISVSDVSAGHTGPKYDKIPSGCVVDKTSATRDCSDGTEVTWQDGFNQRHQVVLGKGESVTVIFPIAQGGTWTWYDGDKERTGFNRATAWVEATFAFNDGDLEIRSTGWIVGEPAPGLLEEILKSLKMHIGLVGEIVNSGAQTVEEAAKIADVIKGKMDEAH
jgi:hypothetical protein